jgi:hypothetical protein
LLPEIYNKLSESPHINVEARLLYASLRAKHAKEQGRPNMLSSALFDAVRYGLQLQKPGLVQEQVNALIAALGDTALWTTGGQ